MARLITPEVERALTCGRLAHLVTVNPDGSPQVSLIWVGVEDGEIVSGHLGERRKLSNVRRNPHVVLSMEVAGRTEHGLDHYIVVRGRARITEGGAPALLQRLAHVYLGPEVRFPPMEEPPEGVILRITPERISGVGPWT